MENLFASSGFFSSKGNGISAVKNGSDLNSSIEISDLIFNFCNWESQVKNGSVLNQEEGIAFESGDGRREEGRVFFLYDSITPMLIFKLEISAVKCVFATCLPSKALHGVNGAYLNSSSWVVSIPKLGTPQQNSFVGQANVSRRIFLSP